MSQIKTISTLAAVAGLLVCFQNCSDNYKITSSGTSAQGVASSSEPNIPSDTPISPVSGGGVSGTIFQPPSQSGSTAGIIIQPPIPIAQTNCSIPYPFFSTTAATNVAFNESDVLVGFSPMGPVGATAGNTLTLWYSDEHAMTLGVRRVTVIAPNGTKTNTDYAVAPLTNVPSALLNPSVGTIALAGDQAGTDTSQCYGTPGNCGRPLFPALFITDTTGNAGNLSGDWQYGGTAITPTAVFGTWKAAVRTVDHRNSPATVTVTPDADPAPNSTNLAGVAFPSGAVDEGYSTAVSWDLSRLGLVSGHSYRLQFMVHDGDENRSGGDVGENCVNVTIP